MTTITPAPVRNGIDTAQVYGTLDAIKAQPELGRFEFRVDNRWITDVSDDPLDGESFEVVVGALRLHEHSHAITLADQRANRRGSYEPRRARDEHRIRIGMIVHS